MTWATPSKSHSLIHTLIVTVVLMVTGYSGAAFAQECSEHDRSTIAKKCSGDVALGDVQSCDYLKSKCKESKGSSSSLSTDDENPKAICRSIKSKVDEASSKYNERCASAGISMNCDATVGRCEGPMTESYRDENAFLAAIGGALGVAPTARAAEKCSNITGREFKDAKSELKKELKDLNNDLKDNEKDINDLNRDYNEAVAKIERELAEQQAAYAEKKGKAAQDEQKAKIEFEQQLAQLRQKQRGYEASKVKLNNTVRTIVRTRNAKLELMLNDKDTIVTCFEQASKIQPPKKAHASAGALTNSGAQRSQMQQLAFTKCKQELQQRRLEIIEENEAQLREVNQQINDTQSEIDQVTQDIASTVQQYEEFLKQQAQGKDDGLKALNKQIELANKERTALDLDTQKRGEAFTKREQQLRGEANATSTEMMLLGNPPPKASGDVSVANAYSAKRQLNEYLREYEATCKDEYDRLYSKENNRSAKPVKSAPKGGIGG